MADLIYMAKSKWQGLLDTIRTKGGTSAPMTADEAIAAVEAIETGGGEETQGLVDLTINYTNSEGKSWIGSVENNSIKNFYTSEAYCNVPLVLKTPIVIETNDVVTMTLENAYSDTSFWADYTMLPVAFHVPVPISIIKIAVNFLFPKGPTTVSQSMTYTGNPVIVNALTVYARNTALPHLSADVHLDINNVRIF